MKQNVCRKNKFGIVYMEKHVDIDILKKFVVIRSVVFLIVKRDTLTFAILTENLEDVNLQHIVSTVITSKLMLQKIVIKLKSFRRKGFPHFENRKKIGKD